MKRGKVFGGLSKLIRIAVKEGKSGDPKFNPTLRTILDKARAANMPKEKIQRAIERGLGISASGVSIQEITYEGFGPGGIPMIAVAHTDNTNRTSSEVRFAFSRHGGSLGSPGSAMYLFTRGSEGIFEPTMKMDVTDKNTESQLRQLVEALEDLDDMEDVFLAADLPGEEE